MRSLLRGWLDELRADGLHLSQESGDGAVQNLWCMSLPTSEPVTASDLLAFLESAMVIRRELAQSQPVRPVTFYAWHDEMVGQLRFSTACCTRTTLPFRAEVRVVDEPDEIIAAWISSPYRDGIPCTELEEVNPEADGPLPEASPRCVTVWAAEWS